MCGIVGILSKAAIDPPLLMRMAGRIAHRGPDDFGFWHDPEVAIAFGHRRLSILDLSAQGHQPMASSDGRYVISFNGEIYNHSDLRREVEHRSAPDGGWRGHSDTEVLVEAIRAWGLPAAVGKCAGMFAFALWDRKERRLSLVRDRFGEKPLYYGWAGGDFLFGSELKALRDHPRFENAIDRRSLSLFASRTYIPAPFSIYRGVFKLPPGCILEMIPQAALRPLTSPPEEGTDTGGLSLKRYWSYRDVMLGGLEQPFRDEDEALAALEEALGQAIKGQSVADVPLGAFLSGGVDSSTIVALYQMHSANPVRTYSIGFEEAGFNEAEHAKSVAEHLGTVHHEHYVTVREAQDVIPLLPAIYDEPFADSSQIPTYLVSRFARNHVKVALTGDGGDELFAGYNRHFAAPRLWRHLQRMPVGVRSMTGALAARLPSIFWAKASTLLGAGGQPHVGTKVKKALLVGASARSFDDVYCSFLDEWCMEPPPVRGEQYVLPLDMELAEGAADTLRMMYCDAVTYLPDDILCKVDRASMAVSLETRVPFLDHRVAQVAARIPLEMKVREGKGKQILRRLLYRHVPRELVERPKAGFAIPVGEWIKGPLRPWAEDLLDPARLSSEGWFDPAVVRRRWAEHLRGERDSTPAIWAVLMFEAWLREQPNAFAAAA